MITPCKRLDCALYMKNLFFVDLCVVLGVAALQLVRRHDGKSLSLNELFNSTQIRLFPNVDIQSMNDSLIEIHLKISMQLWHV